MFSRIMCSVLCLVMLPAVVISQEKEPSKWAFNGYVKYLQTENYIPQTNDLVANTLFHNRLNLKWYPHENWTFVVEARNRAFFGEETKLIPNYGKLIDAKTGLVDLSVLWVDDPNLVLHTIVDRAYVDFRKGKFEARLGRQRINWGINTVWNPNDLFNALNFLDFDYEERPGSDALRLTYYPGMTSSIELAFAPAENLDESVAAGLFKFNKWNYDFQVLSGYFQGDVAVGGGWSGYIKSAGFKGEASYFYPTNASPDSMGTVNLSVSGDYQINKGPYLIGSVFYNSRGVQKSANLLTGLASSQLSAKNLFPTEWAFFVSASGPLTPLLNLNGSVIYSPNGNLVAFIPTVTYSIKENWDIDLIGQSFFADDPAGYAHQGTSLFLRLKWSY